MAAKFQGSLDEFKWLVKEAERAGDWTEPTPGYHVFRTDSGEILNWWPKTGTFNCQGKNAVEFKVELERLQKEAAARAANKRLRE